LGNLHGRALESIPMINVRFGYMASFAAMALSVPALRADDTTRLLAGTGSLQNPTNVATKTLKGTGASDADTVPVCCWWKRACCCAPVCPAVVYSAPVFVQPAFNVLPVPTMAPPPAAGPASYYYPPPRIPETFAVAPRLNPTGRPVVVVGYQGRIFNGTVAIRPAARFAAPTQPYYGGSEMMPPPQPNDRYRYDGGPNRPVPMPVPDPVSPTDPVPTTVPALHRVMIQQQARPKVNYPAYGEKPANKQKIVDPLMVKLTNP
jgi:hypothetical protein